VRTNFLLKTFVFLALATGLWAEIRVSAADAIKAAVSKPKPEYSPMARQMKIEGDVEIEVHINAAGGVDSAKPISGNPILTSMVTKAVKDWKFTPFTAEGKAVPAVTTLKFSFKL